MNRRSIIAKVTVSLTVETGTWNPDATFEQIEKQASVSVLDVIKRMIIHANAKLADDKITIGDVSRIDIIARGENRDR